jgi:hypothetical protein
MKPTVRRDSLERSQAIKAQSRLTGTMQLKKGVNHG